MRGEENIAELLASTVRSVSEAVLLTQNRSGAEAVVFANDAFQRLTGYSAAEIEGHDLMLLRGPETNKTILQQLLEPSRDEAGPVEICLYKKDGTPFWDRIRKRRLNDEFGSYSVQLHSEVAGHGERAMPANDVSDIAHDFNNLLTAILVYSGLLASRVQDDSQLGRYINEIRASAERGAELAAQLLKYEHQGILHSQSDRQTGGSGHPGKVDQDI